MKCCVCGEIAIVFVGDAGESNADSGYCLNHAPIELQNMFSEKTSSLQNLAEQVARTKHIPIAELKLEDGSLNPIYGRDDLRRLSAEEFLETINGGELDSDKSNG